MKKLNLIFIFADQLNYRTCGFGGEARARTPNLDRLAGESANFTQAVSTNPLCGPYRASLFTGKYPSSTGQFNNDLRCRPDREAIGHRLEAAGYRTGYIGKWHLYCRNAEEQYTPPGPHRLGFDQYFASYNWNHDYWNGYYYLDEDRRIPMEGYQTDFQTDMALRFLERQGPEPFALFVSYEVPHPPCTAADVPAEYYDLFEDADFGDLLYDPDEVFEEFTPSFDRAWQRSHVIEAHRERCRSYFAMTACLDANVGRILESLERSGLAEDTIVVFTSDHGDMLGGHGRIEKRIFFEESVRVPFLLRWKGTVPAESNDFCLGTPDIAATLLDLMGQEIPPGYEGVSFAPALTGRGASRLPDRAFITNMSGGFFNNREEYRAVRTARHLYARMVRTGKEFLFDHRADPKEERNLAADPDRRGLLEDLRASLAETMRSLGDEALPAEWYQEHWVREGEVAK